MSQGDETARRAKIRELNDAFRKSFVGGRVMMTDGVAALPECERTEALRNVQTFNAFSPDNDPHREHDFGAFEIAEQKFFWKIDCYDPTLHFGSDDASNSEITTRVLTIMLAEEY